MLGNIFAASRRDLIDSLGKLSEGCFADLAKAVDIAASTLQCGGGLFFLGNGGSAATAEHLAAELVGRFSRERRPLRASSLTANSSVLTALLNDYGPDQVFARQVEAEMKPCDLLVALSASGRSANILRALDAAGQLGCSRIGMTGTWIHEFSPRCESVLSVPCSHTPRIQEVHLLLGHMLCEGIENLVFPPLGGVNC